MISAHLRPLLASPPMLHWLFRLGEHLVTARVPDQVVEAVRMGRVTALRKPSGGVRGIVVGDVIRRLVARTVAQQVSSCHSSESVRTLHEGLDCECVSHVVQAMCEANPLTTIVSVDSVSAYDTISREAMMHGLSMEGGECLLPFVRQFYGGVSQYLWEDAEGVTHTISQGEGGEQGDPLMPMHCSLGQHHALEAVNRSLRPGETLMAFLDDVYVVTPDPERVGVIYTSIQEHLWVHSSIRIDGEEEPSLEWGRTETSDL